MPLTYRLIQGLKKATLEKMPGFLLQVVVPKETTPTTTEVEEEEEEEGQTRGPPESP